MRGLVQGEQSSSSNPVLQFFVRYGGLLVDPVSATFKIDDIHDAAVALVNRVPVTSFDLVVHKLGTGRFFVPSGTTSAWSLGTHRVTCTYSLVTGGPTYTQTILFELLDPTDWAGTSNSWTSYISTRRVRQDALVSSSVSTATLHRTMNRIAKQIEGWCRRFFEPRYMTMRRSGQEVGVLRLDEAVIALDGVSKLYWAIGAETAEAYDSDYFKVYNRHLDSGHDSDDRFDPRVDHVSSVWPSGDQNLQVSGVFGYTDPEHDPLGGRTLLGQTPEDIIYVSGVLLARAVTDPALTDIATARSGSIISYKTRHQSITFGGTATDGTSGSLSGDPLIDSILVKYGPPLNITGV